jgi:AraC-like DNA-binding protein
VYEKNIFYKEYEELNNSQNMANYLETQGILLQLIARFVDSDQFENKTPATIPSKILEAISFIQLNLRHPLTVAQLAQRANQHPDYFSRQFVNYAGERPLTYIQQKRIERAQYLITTTLMPYLEIADATGFETLSYFSKVFKKLTGTTPDQYRKAQRSTNA